MFYETSNYIIDKFADIINGCVCIRIVGGHSFYDMVSQFSTVYLYSIEFGIKILTCWGLCQTAISTQKLSIYVKNMLTKFHEIQGPVTYFLT